MKNKVNIFRKTTLVMLGLVAASFIVSCVGDELFRDELPDSNSQIDTKLPQADFSYLADVVNFAKVNFTDLSTESTTYLWNFGGGATSTLQDPTYTFAGEGTFPVTLMVSDGNGASDTISIDVVVIEPEEPEALIPVILEPGFDRGNDSRDVWRNSDLGGVIQITGSTGYYEGTNGAKLPNSADRIGYQEISEFTPNTDYVLKFKYRMKDNVGSANGLLHVRMLKATNNLNDVEANTVGQVTFSEAVAGTSELATGTLIFNSGTNTSLAIYFYNELDEAYIDSFEIDLQ